jgi:glycosyltransferase involved in cell wall biosynthesis
MSKKIILIGNYKPDKQCSMLIFEALMMEGYIKLEQSVAVIRPIEIIGKLSFVSASLFKWLGYIDKFVFFPLFILLFRFKNILLFRSVNYHICDHSNAFYLYFLPKQKTIITCHDVLAIRASLGFTDTYCSTSKSGKILQKIILNALSGATKLAAVSEFTLNQLKNIDSKPMQSKKWICIHNALSDKFKPLQREQLLKVLDLFQELKGQNIILHVGSDLERKNRKLLLHMMHELPRSWEGKLVLAGEPLNIDLTNLITKLQLTDRVVQIHRPTDLEIVALYSYCEAMVFPSYSEGFGWPIIEAQACGAPVITTNKAPMMSEVGGIAALYADPDVAKSFVDQLMKLQNLEFRKERILLGYENAKRFNFDHTVNQYLELLKN